MPHVGKSVVNSQWVAGETVYNIIDPGSVLDVLEVHKTRRTLKHDTMDGYDIAITKRTWGDGYRKFNGLRTREDVINTVLNVPGAYIYSATSAGGGGHAFAFNSSSGRLSAFMDPNQGEWTFAGETDNAIRSWWSDFWEAKGDEQINYKKAFHNGKRELWKVDVAN